MRTPLPELSAHELLEEWRKVIDAAAASLASFGDHVETPREPLDLMRRQLELVQELGARERRLQQQAASQLLAPVDAVFNLLEASGTALRNQAEALEAAGQALEESARMVAAQAGLFERAISGLREPTDKARAVIGLEQQARPPSRPGSRRVPKRPAARG